MRDSVGKTVAREHFYKEWLPSWLTCPQLKSCSYVLLIGTPPEEPALPPEIKHLDDLGVRRRQIWSVERDGEIYALQAAFNRNQRLRDRLSLYQGEINHFLLDHLHRAQDVGVLNLDIEGSFLGASNGRNRRDAYLGIDEAMTTVMLFCWRNPSTVVATYSNVGRDRIMLCEGVKSLVWLLAVAREPVVRFCLEMASRYEQASFEHPFRMVLRDLFWIRSHLEHTLAASVAVGSSSRSAAAAYFALGEELWQRFAAEGSRTYSLRTVMDRVETAVSDIGTTKVAQISDNARLGLSFRQQKHVVYRGQRPWSQRCFYAAQRREDQTISSMRWIAEACAGFTDEPFLYIDIEGCRHELRSDAIRSEREINVNDDKKLFSGYRPREVNVTVDPAWRPALNWLRQDIHECLYGDHRAIVEPAQMGQATDNGSATQPSHRQQGETSDMARTKKTSSKSATTNGNGNGDLPKPRKFVDSAGALTDQGRAYLKHLAQDRGLSTPQIMERVPEDVPVGTVRALVAHASRAKKA